MSVSFITCEGFMKERSSFISVDVRSPAEFVEGHIPEAVNIPLLNNKDRKAVGIIYKEKGSSDAIKLGFQLITEEKLLSMIEQTKQLLQKRRLLIYCQRGGLRSHYFCQFMDKAGIKVNVLSGGYKSYRFNNRLYSDHPFQLILIAGSTGTGKSEILRTLKRQGEQIIDLESLARHKGSVFGGLGMPKQPTTEHFQNLLCDQLRKIDISRPLWAEDESIAIGRVFLPQSFWNTMRKSPVVILTMDKDLRVARLVREYGKNPREEFLSAMQKITKRIGTQRYQEAKKMLINDDMSGFISILLPYYDKTYQYNLTKRQPRVLDTIAWNGQQTDAVADALRRSAEKIFHIL